MFGSKIFHLKINKFFVHIYILFIQVRNAYVHLTSNHISLFLEILQVLRNH